MNEPVKHHYTPQFYLSAWCSVEAAGQASNLWVVENIAGRISRFRRSPKATGFENHLYSFSDTYTGAKRAALETEFFSRLDNDGSALVSKLIAQEQLTHEERGLWAAFVVYMRVRTPENIALVRETGRKSFFEEIGKGQAEYTAIREGGDPESIFEWMRRGIPASLRTLGLRTCRS